MLKIKDNVDLDKTLTKYGFDYQGCCMVRDLKQNQDYYEYITLEINRYNRKIMLSVNYEDGLVDENLDVLFDLIQAGLVEKVMEKKTYSKNKYFDIKKLPDPKKYYIIKFVKRKK